MDSLFLAYDRSTTQIYVQLFKNRIAEDIYFKEKLAGTSPGFYYIYDITKDQVQSSYKSFDYVGYAPAECHYCPYQELHRINSLRIKACSIS